MTTAYKNNVFFFFLLRWVYVTVSRLLFDAVHGLLTAVASLAAEHRL